MKTTKKLLARVMVLAMVLCMMFALAAPAMASSVNEKVLDAKKGVVQIEIWYVDPEMADEVQISGGTGFLVNSKTVVTCQHVVSGFSDAWYAARAQETSAALGRHRTAKEIKENMQYRISVLRDVHVQATIRQSSEEMDFAILTLNDDLYTLTPMTLRKSSELRQTESVHALGFPSVYSMVTDAEKKNSESAVVTSGTVNKVGESDFSTENSFYNDVLTVEHSAIITR